MKAVVSHEFAPFRHVVVEQMPDPVPGPGELVIDIEASDVNFPDILQIEGMYQVRAPRPFIPGLGAIGRVSAVGPEVADFVLGQRVLALPDGAHAGTHAEKARVPASFCFIAPEDVPSDIGAALGLAYQTAHAALTRRALLQAGESILVLGATGGIGMAAIQLARALGASCVIAATRGKEGTEIAREMGADHVIDTRQGELKEVLRHGVRSVTGGAGVDVVIDPVGGSVGEAALRTLAWHGRLVVVGFASGDIPSFKGNYLLIKGISVCGMQWTDYQARDPQGIRDAQAKIFDLWRSGRLSPRISRRLPLSRAVEGFEAVAMGDARGKIILLPETH